MDLSTELSEIVNAIKDDETIKDPLLKILNLPDLERNEALKKLAFVMKNQGAPQDFIDALLSLQKTALARAVLKEL